MSITKLIEVTVGNGGASTIEVTGIPQNYTDLYVTTSLRSNRSAANLDAMRFTLNGSTSGYTGKSLIGFGSGNGYSESNNDQYGQPNPFLNLYASTGPTAASGCFAYGTMSIPNYTASSNKTISIDYVIGDNAVGSWVATVAGMWANSAAVTSITLSPFYGTLWAAGSSISVYGVSRTQAIGAPKAIGGVISYANNRWFHTFTSSGTFSTKQALNVDALIVGGGGGGGAYDAGGGGAGGYQTLSTALNTAGNYSVTVGAGGPGGIYYSPGRNGAPSNFLSTTSNGGGGGGSAMTYQGAGEAGNPGASGGGARGGRGGGNTGGSGTAGQGNAGGSAAGSAGYGAGGGGGAGSAGGNGTTGANGSGGAGVQWINGNYYAGGGGGCVVTGYGIGTPGAGGIGGGGAGGTPPVAGTSNTGGGGGGNRDSTPGATGGSGVVIISYPAN